MRRLSPYRKLAIALIIAGTAVLAPAQAARRHSTLANDGLEWQLVKTGLYVISGDGSNSVVRLSGNGIIVVNGNRPSSYKALRARITTISDQAVRVLILTDCNESSAGTNAQFLQDGTPIVMQQNALRSFAACHPSAEKSATPVITYDRDYHIKLGGVEAQLMYFGNAQSDSNSVVYFPNVKAIAVGDLVASTPNPDYSAGGSLVGWRTVLEQVLKLDFDVAIPSTGPTITRAELEAFKTKMDSLVSRATGLVNKGVPKDQLMSQLKTDDLGWQLKFTPDQVDHFYIELSEIEQPTHQAQLGGQPAGKP
ncbi:MAG: hypothetical protein WA655_04020 [Candidatus Korobacteraceae bacterium]